MQKAFTDASDINKFKTGYEKGRLKIALVSSCYPLRAEHPAIDEFLNFFNDRSLHLMIMLSEHAQPALQEEFGDFDFKSYKGRVFNNWVVEHEGLHFIVPEKREMVVSGDDSDFFTKVISFEKNYMQFVLNNMYKNKDKMDKDTLNEMARLEKDKIIVDGKIDFSIRIKNKIKP